MSVTDQKWVYVMLKIFRDLFQGAWEIFVFVFCNAFLPCYKLQTPQNLYLAMAQTVVFVLTCKGTIQGHFRPSHRGMSDCMCKTSSSFCHSHPSCSFLPNFDSFRKPSLNVRTSLYLLLPTLKIFRICLTFFPVLSCMLQKVH